MIRMNKEDAEASTRTNNNRKEGYNSARGDLSSADHMYVEVYVVDGSGGLDAMNQFSLNLSWDRSTYQKLLLNILIHLFIVLSHSHSQSYTFACTPSAIYLLTHLLAVFRSGRYVKISQLAAVLILTSVKFQRWGTVVAAQFSVERKRRMCSAESIGMAVVKSRCSSSYRC
jgi:hypothetical protein